MSRALYKSVTNRSAQLLKISEECDRHRYVYIGGNLICSFLTNDNFYKFISSFGNNLTPYCIATGDENIYFLTPHFKFLEKI